jgi:predicted 2-oxoglutarate/Fe(II)-dependent dioxygenase YbiX
MTCKYDTKKIDLTELFPHRKDPFAISLDNVFTKEECNELIRRTEEIGYIPALVGKNQIRVETQRNNTRCIVDDNTLAQEIYSRIKDHVPMIWLNCPVLELNPRLRFLKYEPGQYFLPHSDGVYVNEEGTKASYITIHLYLNEDYEGGETTFTTAQKSYGYHRDKIQNDPVKKVPFKGKTGQVLLFEHHLVHGKKK